MTRVMRVLLSASALAVAASVSADPSATVSSEPVPDAEVRPPDPSGAPGGESRPPDPGRFAPRDEGLPLGEAAVPVKPSATAAAEPEPPAIPEVVVSAARSPRPARTTPDSVTVVTRRDLAGRPAADLADAVERAAGTDALRYGPVGSVAAASLRGARASQVLVLQDGRPINAVGSGDADLSRVPLGQVDRVEVVRGPAGLLYGSGALGGVINAIPPRPPDEFSGVVEARDGTFGTRALHAGAGGPAGPVRWLVSGDEISSAGYRPNSDYRGRHLLATVSAPGNPAVTVTGVAGDSSLGVPGARPAQDPALRSPTTLTFGDGEVSSLVDRQDDRRRAADAKVEWTIRDGHRITARHYVEFNELDFRFGYDPGSFFGNPVINTTHAHTDLQGAELTYDGGPLLAEDVRLTAGAGWRKERLRNTEDSYDILLGGGVLGRERIRARVEVGSAFGSASVRPLARLGAAGERLTVAAGGRYDRHSIFGGVMNAHGGAALDLGAAVLKVSAGTAFRAPALNDLFWPQTPFDGGNPALRPERGRVAEWGIERSAGGLRARLGGFVRTVHDQIDWAPDATGKWQPRNVGRVRVDGTEAEASATRGRVTVRASLTTLDAVQRNPETVEVDPFTFAPVRTEVRERRAPHLARYIGSATLSVRGPRGVVASADVRHAGDRVMYLADYSAFPVVGTTEKRLPPFTTVGVRLDAPVTARTTAYAGVENLTGRRYAVRFGNNAADRDYPMPPRTFYAGLRAEF